MPTAFWMEPATNRRGLICLFVRVGVDRFTLAFSTNEAHSFLKGAIFSSKLVALELTFSIRF